jgi:hypothetical protein
MLHSIREIQSLIFLNSKYILYIFTSCFDL